MRLDEVGYLMIKQYVTISSLPHSLASPPLSLSAFLFYNIFLLHCFIFFLVSFNSSHILFISSCTLAPPLSSLPHSSRFSSSHFLPFLSLTFSSILPPSFLVLLFSLALLPSPSIFFFSLSSLLLRLFVSFPHSSILLYSPFLLPSSVNPLFYTPSPYLPFLLSLLFHPPFPLLLAPLPSSLLLPYLYPPSQLFQ